ncbi:MAG: hypothetical protein ACREP1_01425, partial [Rhodanobacteraceae bacterium]
MNLIAELKRRNVIRAAGLYLVGAWLLVQVAGTILPMFGAPEWIARSLVILLAIGLVPALVIAWLFELTPSGLKRDEDVPAQESIAPQTARRMDRLILIVAIIAVAYFAFDKFVLAPRREAVLVAQTTTHVTAAISAENSKVNPRSIAVLPLDNYTGDPKEDYFAEGMTDELTTDLANISQLRVISRSSTLQFAGKQRPPTPEIAKLLNVDAVVEGSVQRQGDKVRITAQLIDARADRHLWAKSFERNSRDVLALEAELASAIAGEINVRLTPGEQVRLTSAKSVNPEAHDAYL